MEAPVWDVTHNVGVNRANVGGGGMGGNSASGGRTAGMG